MQDARVIARISGGRAAVPLLVVSAAVLAVIVLPFVGPGGIRPYLNGQSRWTVLLFVAWAGTFLVVRQMLWVLNQLFFSQRAGIWLTDDQLIYLNKRRLSVPRASIADAIAGHSPVLFFQLNAIVLRLKDGTDRTIVSGLFDEPREVILSRLKSLIQ